MVQLELQSFWTYRGGCLLVYNFHTSLLQHQIVLGVDSQCWNLIICCQKHPLIPINAICLEEGIIRALNKGKWQSSLNFYCSCYFSYTTSNYHFHVAANYIHRGEVDLMMAGGIEAVVIHIGLKGCLFASEKWWFLNCFQGCGTRIAMVLSWVRMLRYPQWRALEPAMKWGAPIIVAYLRGAVDFDAHPMADPRPDEFGVSSCIKSILEDADVTHPIPIEEEMLKVNSSSHGEWALLNGSSIAAGSEGWAGPHNVIFWTRDYSSTHSHLRSTCMATFEPQCFSPFHHLWFWKIFLFFLQIIFSTLVCFKMTSNSSILHP